MQMKILLAAGVSAMLFTSCVSSKKYQSEVQRVTELQTQYANCQSETSELRNRITALQTENDGLKQQSEYLKQNNNTALKQLEDLSVISSQQAESIRKSMENIGAKDAYIQDLQKSMARKDSLNMALVMNLKGAIGNLNDQDINIKVDKGVVYIDISDKLLFNVGKFDITPRAKEVLGKVATVLKNQPNIEFMVEGHTDNSPYRGGGLMLDNWDLSVKRATSVVRVLQNEYGLDPAKMAAAGRSEYKPISSNDSPEGKAANRRTRIVILPELDQFFKLLERPQS